MIVMVTGGRDYDREDLVWRGLDYFDTRVCRISLVVSGACTDPNDRRKMRGADLYAITWALVRERDFNGRPARWIEEGYPQAGPMRNERTLRSERPNYLMGFPGGRGTVGCIALAHSLGIKFLDGIDLDSWRPWL